MLLSLLSLLVCTANNEVGDEASSLVSINFSFLIPILEMHNLRRIHSTTVPSPELWDFRRRGTARACAGSTGILSQVFCLRSSFGSQSSGEDLVLFRKILILTL